MSKLGETFPEKYSNFFKFFRDSNKSIKEITTFIERHSIPNYSSEYNKIHLNMIDPKNLNILFHVIRNCKSDDDCLQKLRFLIEKYNINYNIFDINRRTLPFYTCVKGFLNSTIYLVEKMDYDISLKDNKEETLFFSAIRSYNLQIVKYLDNKYKGWIYYPNGEYDSCIFNIFKKTLKNEGEMKIKELLKYIIDRGFNIEQKNKNKISFKDLCIRNNIDKYLDDVLCEKNKGKNINNIKKENNNKKKNDANIINKNMIKPSINEFLSNNLKSKSLIIKKDEKINQPNSINSSNHLMNKIPQSNIIKTNGNSKSNGKKENKDSEKKQKKICCLFVNSKNELIINKIYEKISSNEFLKEKYLNKINDSLSIPSFEKGRINIIKQNLSKNI